MTPLNQRWRDLQQIIMLDCPEHGEELVQRVTDLITAERMGIAVAEQVKALRYAQSKLGLTAAAYLVAMVADDVEAGRVKL